MAVPCNSESWMAVNHRKMITWLGTRVWENNRCFLKFRSSSAGGLTSHMMSTCYRIMSGYLSAVNMRRIRFLGSLHAKRKSKLGSASLVRFPGRTQGCCSPTWGTPWGRLAFTGVAGEKRVRRSHSSGSCEFGAVLASDPGQGGGTRSHWGCAHPPVRLLGTGMGC